MILLNKKNNSNVDKLTDKMKEIIPKTADERVVFNKWMDDEADPMVDGVIKLMEAIFRHSSQRDYCQICKCCKEGGGTNHKFHQRACICSV
jgi:hypothetical protein